MDENKAAMIEDEAEKYENYYLPELLSEKAVPRFGTLLRQVCDAVGISQPKLEAYAQAEYEQLEKAGFFSVFPDTPPSSMLQEVISRVIRGKQPPSYSQTYIWITVIKRHYNDQRVKDIFERMDLEPPKFDPELEDALWALSGHQPPKAVVKAALAVRDFSRVPRRLPKGVNLLPQTDANLQIVQRATKDLSGLQPDFKKVQEPELQH